MPKKFKGENSKAQEARARKEAVRLEEVAKKQAAIEDEYWKDDDKNNARKQQRKEEKEKKRLEQLEKKKEAEALLEEEMASLKSGKPTTSKVTRADIEANKQAAAAAAGKEKSKDAEEEPLPENVNRIQIDGEQARSVDQALSVLGDNKDSGVDMHPEKRMKAAFKAYEEKQLAILKAENSNMRLSQLKQMIKKDWMKSPENPMIQHQMAKLNLS